MRHSLVNHFSLLFFQVLGIFILCFFLIHLVPGDPVLVMLGETASLADQDHLRAQLGLDKPLFDQLLITFKNILNGNLGYSFFYQQPVSHLIKGALINTYHLALVAIFITMVIGLSAGFYAAKNQNSWVDRCVSHTSVLFISIPHFFLGPLLILFLSIFLGWLPVSGMESPVSIILPALTLAMGLIAITVKMTRNCMIELLESDVARTARAKGLSEQQVLLRHVFRLVLMPIITILAMQFGSLLSGAVITETIFSWNGLGKLLVDSIQSRDYPVTQACVLVIATSYVLINFLTEFIYRWADPRVRTDAHE